MKSLEIRHRFFSYFEKYNHTPVTSSSLIPAQDPTLLFANAGMNQFKDVFLGMEKRTYTRAVSIQKCVRAGGKHNDLDNVGFTKRHLTFFEMMGNFSFGDYFKKEAIRFAWDFLTKEIKLPVEQLHATVFYSDDESYDLWLTMIGIPAQRIHRLGEADNFWQMGDVGPCGPCTEIHIDRGTAFGCKDEKACGPSCACDRFLEIWNLVFMQFDRQPDGNLKALKQTGVDTGMGLERLCAVAQEKDSVFQTDLFEPILKHIETLTGISYLKSSEKDRAAFHVLADHIRSSTLLIADGCAPSNDGRGYVLRKIIRRAALFAQKLSEKNIFPELSKVVIEHMGNIYPELLTNRDVIYAVLDSEVKKFATNLLRGQQILEEYFEHSKTDKIITGSQAFKLYDTYGFPIELIKVMAQERAYTVDENGFQEHMLKQQEQSGKKSVDLLDCVEFDESIHTEFTGYQELETASTITALVDEHNNVVNQIPAGQTGWVIAHKSPFFIVGGGQVPDQGWLIIEEHTVPILAVRYINGRIAAKINMPIDVKVGSLITSRVDKTWRTNAMKNHTATHLLQAALIELFGKQIKQSGSLVHPDYLRFDFTYHENLSAQDITKVEELVNQKIMDNIPVHIEYLSLKEALNKGALAFFGDKYNPENVRLVRINDFSAELCGGTHVPATGVIGSFKITEVSSLSAGHRRIVAVTGPQSLALYQETFNIVKTLTQEFAAKREQVVEIISKQKDQIKDFNTQIKQLKQQIWSAQLPQWQKQITEINGIPFLFLTLNNYTSDNLRDIANHLIQKQPGFYFLLSLVNNKPLFLASLSSQFENRFNLKNFASWLKDTHNLKGGGSKNMIQGSGDALDSKLEESVRTWVARN